MKRINIFLLFIACAIPLIALILPMVGFKEVIEKADWYSPFYIFTLQFGAGALLFIKLFKDFTIWLKDIQQNNSKLTLSILLILLITVLLICFLWIEGRSRVQMDESIYLSVAQNLYHNQVGTICVEGAFEDGSLECNYQKTIKPRGLSYLYMLGMPIFGTDLYWVYNFQVFILALTIPIFFLALLAWLKNKWLALLSVTLLAMQPVLLFYSRSSSIEGFYVLMFSLSLLFLKWAYDRNTTRHWLLLALTLAFFAQTRTEAVFCLFAFIAVVLYKTTLNSQLSTLNFLKNFLKNFQFSTFLATLSFFSLPVLCTISYNRDNNLQGGAYGAHGHLFSNIIADFKVMAFPHYDTSGWLSNYFLPYFTWLALFGLITLIILTAREFKLSTLNSQLSIPFKSIAAFLLLLSPQYLILFDGVSADLKLGVQHRFVLIILPAMSFLGALFLWKIGTTLKLRPQIPIYGTIIIILTTTLSHFQSFIYEVPLRFNALANEDYLLNNFILEKHSPSDKNVFFSFTPMLMLAHGNSAFSFGLIFKANKEQIQELIEQYNGNVYASENFCYIFGGHPKMTFPSPFRICDRAVSYFDTDTILNISLSGFAHQVLILHKILGLNERDPKGLLRIMNKVETPDSNVTLFYGMPKDTIAPWQIEHFINDSLVFVSKYNFGESKDVFRLSQFNRDTNVWRLDIVDTVAKEKIHSDFWQLVRVR